jgi:hypothetical protein
MIAKLSLAINSHKKNRINIDVVKSFKAKKKMYYVKSKF